MSDKEKKDKMNLEEEVIEVNTDKKKTKEVKSKEEKNSEESTPLSSKISGEQKSVFNKEEFNIDLGEKLSKLRYFTPVLFMVFMLLLAHSNALTAFLGTTVMILGWILRVYTKVYADSNFDTNSESFGTKIVKEGPYKYVRNPMYISYITILTGMALFSGTIIMILITPIYFAVQYFLISLYEESLLREKNEAYAKYEEEVPAWIGEFKDLKLDCPDMEKIINTVRSDIKMVVAFFIVLLVFCVK